MAFAGDVTQMQFQAIFFQITQDSLCMAIFVRDKNEDNILYGLSISEEAKGNIHYRGQSVATRTFHHIFAF